MGGSREANGRRSVAQMTNLLRLLLLLAASVTLAHAAERPGTILFFGDSLTAGYGLDDPMSTAYPARIQEKLESQGLPYRVINAGLSGETSAGGLRRIDWVLRQPVAVFVLELGANDGLRGLSIPAVRENLGRILDKVRAKNPDAKLVIAGMQMPTSMGSYADDYEQIFPELAEAYNATLIPFLLDGVGGVPELNLPDGIHPTEEGHAIVADTVWTHLRPLLLD